MPNAQEYGVWVTLIRQSWIRLMPREAEPCYLDFGIPYLKYLYEKCAQQRQECNNIQTVSEKDPKFVTFVHHPLSNVEG